MLTLIAIYLGIGLTIATVLFATDPYARTGSKFLGFIFSVVMWPFIVLCWVMGVLGWIE